MHRRLHVDGQRLIDAWFKRAWDSRGDDSLIFESFVFAWIAVNAWAACITGRDDDRQYMDRLVHDPGLCREFSERYQSDLAFQEEADSFFELLPIFKAQELRRQSIHVDKSVSRQDHIRLYFEAGLRKFEPECARFHIQRGESIPRDWPHFIKAVYRVRCNLFHGEKSAHSEMDGRIVKCALMSLTSFFRTAEIL